MLHTNLCFHGVFQTNLKSGMCCPQNHVLVVYCRQKPLNIFIVFGGLEWAALGCSSSSKQRSRKQQQQRVGRRQMLPGIGTLRGERTPGV